MMKPNTTAHIINRKPQARTACLIAIVCLMLLAATYTSAALAEARVIRVTAADIAKLTARENYIVDLRQSDVVYDLDGTARAIDWNRVILRGDTGDMASTAYFRERFPDNAGATPARFVIGEKGGVQKVLGFKAPPNPGTEYKCPEGHNFCGCVGGVDCDAMLAAKVCGNNKVGCEVRDNTTLVCTCDTN